MNLWHAGNIFLWYVKDGDVSFTHQKHMFDKKTGIIIIFGVYIFLCVPSYNSKTLILRNITSSP